MFSAVDMLVCGLVLPERASCAVLGAIAAVVSYATCDMPWYMPKGSSDMPEVLPTRQLQASGTPSTVGLTRDAQQCDRRASKTCQGSGSPHCLSLRAFPSIVTAGNLRDSKPGLHTNTIQTTLT